MFAGRLAAISRHHKNAIESSHLLKKMKRAVPDQPRSLPLSANAFSFPGKGSIGKMISLKKLAASQPGSDCTSRNICAEMI